MSKHRDEAFSAAWKAAYRQGEFAYGAWSELCWARDYGRRELPRAEGNDCTHRNCAWARNLTVAEARIAELERENARLKEDTPAMCAYCSFEAPKGSKVEVLQKHVLGCEFHPLVKRIAELERELVAWEKSVNECHEIELENLKRIAELETDLREFDHEFATVNEMRTERDAALERVRVLQEHVKAMEEVFAKLRASEPSEPEGGAK